jgi:hypothetical protein
MRLDDLAWNRLTGALNGGPGEINRVWYGSNDMLSGQPAATPAKPSAKANQLLGLHVKYHGSITGNTKRHQVTFHDNVQVAYGPVGNWDALLTTGEGPDRLGPDGAVAGCDELGVVQMPLPTGDGQAIELEMSGSKTFVEGTTFKAVGNHITYAQAKELLVLEGNPAELFRQMQIGAPATRLPAKKMLYWRKTNDVRVIGAQMLEVQLPDGKTR